MDRSEGRIYAVVGGLQAHIADALAASVGARVEAIAIEGASALRDQLLGSAEVPEAWDTDVFGIGSAQELVDLADSTDGPLGALTGFLGRARRDVERLLEARDAAELLARARGVLDDPGRHVLEGVAPFVVGQVGALAALVTSVRRLASADAAREVRAAVLAYFFTAAGYETVDGERLVAPVQLPHLAGGGAAVPSPRTAEFYIRDLGRLVVEAVDDVRFDLKARYAATRGQVGDRADKLARWFRGISALAESAVMGSVEQAVLGVSSFQTNVLIAAAVSTFAGTAARKAAQHVFLHELGA